MPFVKSLEDILSTAHIDWLNERKPEVSNVASYNENGIFQGGINPYFRIPNPQQVLNAMVPDPFTNLFNTTHAPGYLQPLANGGGTGVLEYFKSTTGMVVGGVLAALLIRVIAKRR